MNRAESEWVLLPEAQPGRWARVWLSCFGVILPALTLAIELFTHMCADTFFDPVPTVAHALLIGSVPVANFLFVGGWRGPWVRFLSGLALVVCLGYSLRFAPMFPLAVMAVAWLGLGLLPLSPFLAGLATLFSFTRQVRQGRNAWQGLLVGSLVLAAVTCHPLLTIHWLRAGGDGEVAKLRRWGDRDTMLKACYADLDGFCGYGVDAEKARRLWFRTHGADFSRQTPPRRLGRRQAWGAPSVALTGSRLDGSIDGDAALGYLEWTFSMRGTRAGQEEARLSLALPPGAVVSRATLWVAGEEREAAFASQGQARQAYDKVVATRRDPLLVTTGGPGRVELRCFPVTDKEDMKFRIGMTCPLYLRSRQQATLQLPRVVHHNLKTLVSSDIWLESTNLLKGPWGEGKTLKGSQASGTSATVVAQRNSSVKTVWCPLKEGGVLAAHLESKSPTGDLAVVVDTSQRLAAHRSDIEAALKLFPQQACIYPEQDRLEFVGGKDNLPALEKALSQADTVVWIHGPQECQLSSPTRVQQYLERSKKTLWLVPLEEEGRELLVPQLELPGVKCLPRVGTLAEDVGALRQPGWSWRYEVTTKAPPGAQETSAHLARLWASDVFSQDAAQARERALQYQLVTPLTGAVVLENAKQYRDAGLTPVGPASVPTIPEPGLIALTLVALGLACRSRRAA